MELMSRHGLVSRGGRDLAWGCVGETMLRPRSEVSTWFDLLEVATWFGVVTEVGCLGMSQLAQVPSSTQCASDRAHMRARQRSYAGSNA